VDPTARRILCPIDLTASAAEVVDWAIHMAGERNGQVVLLHAYRLPFELQQIEGACIPDPFWRELREDAERALHAWAERVRRAGVRVSEVAREGPPAQVTLEEAERLDADMIVIGAASRHLLRRWLRGRITERVVSRAPCPVLTVKTH
jgi:nucleotide-binding universal stress UspA family protein